LATDSKHIDRLIARFLAGEATEEERLQLFRWMDESEVNRKYFGDIQFVYEKAVALHRVVKVDVDSAWAKVHRQMKAKPANITQPAQTVSIRVPMWMRIAAIIVLVLGVSLGLYRMYNSEYGSATPTMAISTQDSVINQRLIDSTTVFVNRYSKLSYSPDFGKKDRKLKLEGEAYFDVRHVDDKPFIVEAEGTFVQDIGTAFNLKAYAGDTLVEVYVRKGEVKFFTSDNQGITLSEGETGIYSKRTRTFSRKQAEPGNTLSYVRPVFVFHNTRLSEALQQLSTVYRVSIALGNNSLRDCTISVTFENEDIDVILNIIAETLNLTLAKSDTGYIIEGNGCSKEVE